MKLVFYFTLLTLLIVSAPLNGQNNAKIDKKLNKLFTETKIEKCKEKALKFKSKYPKNEVAYYYLSKIEIFYFDGIEDEQNKNRLKHLKNASKHAKKFKEEYPDYYNEIKEKYKSYILSCKDPDYKSTHVKKALHSYYKTYKEKLPLYSNYYTATSEKEETIFSNLDSQNNDLRSSIINFASKLVGIPYFYTGEKPETGFDCSGFVLYVYKHIGIELPHNAHLQSQLPGKTLTLSQAKPGDLIFFGSRNGNKWSTQHAGIYYGNENGETKVIHCVSRGVTIDGNNSSWDSYWKDKVLFVKRLPELPD